MTTETMNYTTRRTNGYIDWYDIKRIADNGKSPHYFSPETMRFFDARHPQDGYRLGDTVYFITSEKFKALYSSDGPRLYTIRKMDYHTGEIDTVGEFNQLTKSQAKTKLNNIIKHQG